VGAAPPSTILLRKMVPLPHFAGEDERPIKLP
jgi:hypothetical protein